MIATLIDKENNNKTNSYCFGFRYVCSIGMQRERGGGGDIILVIGIITLAYNLLLLLFCFCLLVYVASCVLFPVTCFVSELYSQKDLESKDRRRVSKFYLLNIGWFSLWFLLVSVLQEILGSHIGRA